MTETGMKAGTPEWIEALEALEQILCTPIEIKILSAPVLPRRTIFLSPDLYDDLQQIIVLKKTGP